MAFKKGTVKSKAGYNDNEPSGSNLEKEVGKQSKEIEKINKVLYYVVLILIIMTATIVITVTIDNKNFYNQLQNDRYNFLNEKIDNVYNNRNFNYKR